MEDSLTPAELEAWRAVLVAADVLRFRVAAELRPVTGLSSADHGVLLRLIEEPGHRIPQQSLAERMLWAKGRLSRHLTRMQQRGLVARERDGGTPGVLVALTDRGREAIEAASAVHAAAVRRNLLEIASEEELAGFVRLAARLERLARQGGGA